MKLTIQMQLLPTPTQAGCLFATMRAVNEAATLAARLGWAYGDLLGGCLPDGSYAFVFDSEWSRH